MDVRFRGALLTDRREETGGVVVESYSLNESDFAWQTMMNMLPEILTFGDNPGRDLAIERFFEAVMSDPSRLALANVFVNPIRRVISENPTRQFYKAARRAQTDWFRVLKTILTKRSIVDRAVSRMPPTIRQLSYTGVLIVGGKHRRPDRWPDRPIRRSHNCRSHRP